MPSHIWLLRARCSFNADRSSFFQNYETPFNLHMTPHKRCYFQYDILWWRIMFYIINRKCTNITYTVFNTSLSLGYFRIFQNKNPKLSHSHVKTSLFQNFPGPGNGIFYNFPKCSKTCTNLEYLHEQLNIGKQIRQLFCLWHQNYNHKVTKNHTAVKRKCDLLQSNRRAAKRNWFIIQYS